MKKNVPTPIIKHLSETLKKDMRKNIKNLILFGSRANVILSEAKNLDPSLRSG